jgi:hypothetical protein
MSRAESARIWNLGKISRQAKRGATPAQMFLTGRKAGEAWAHRLLNRSSDEGVKLPVAS